MSFVHVTNLVREEIGRIYKAHRVGLTGMGHESKNRKEECV
jgi:hypothetical protein